MYDDFLNCPLCQEPYRAPKLLTCLHTFCSDCLIAYVDKIHAGESICQNIAPDPESKIGHTGIGTDGVKLGLTGPAGIHHKGITCPVCEIPCHTNSVVDEQFVDSLPDNDFISSLIKTLDACPSQQLVCTACSNTTSCSSNGSLNTLNTDTTSGQDIDIDIESEGEARNSLAVCWCFDCKVGLCDQCKNKHSLSHSAKGHAIVDISHTLDFCLNKRKEKLTPCPKHPDDSIKYFCVNCRVLGCMECTVINHKKHYCVSTKEAIKLYRPEMEGLRKKLRNYHSDLHEIKNAIPLYLEKAGLRCERDVNEYFDKLVAMLRKKQSDLLTELNQIRGVEDKKATLTAELSDRYCRTAHSMYTMLRYLMKYGSENELLLHYEKIRKHDIMQQIIRHQDEKLARYTFYTGSTGEQVSDMLGTNLSLDVSYFRGDFVPKALRLCNRNTSEKVSMKCRQETTSGKRSRATLLLDDCDEPAPSNGGLKKNSFRSQSVSNLAILSSLSDSKSGHVSPSDSFSLTKVSGMDLSKYGSNENLIKLEDKPPLTPNKTQRSNKMPPPRIPADIERRLRVRKLEKPASNSNLRSAAGLSRSVTDISLMMGLGNSDAQEVQDSHVFAKPEVVRREKRRSSTSRARPRSMIGTSPGTIATESKEISQAFERLRRLANMDGQQVERKPDKAAIRAKRMSLYRPSSARFGSVESMNSGLSDFSPSDLPSDSYLRSPTVMAVHDVSRTDGNHGKRLFHDFDGEMEVSFDDEFDFKEEVIGVPSPVEEKKNSAIDKIDVPMQDDSTLNGATLDNVESEMEPEIPLRLNPTPVTVFNCRDVGVQDAAATRNNDDGDDDAVMNGIATPVTEVREDDDRYPAGVVCLADGNMVIADAADNSVKLFTPNGKFLDKFCLHGENPEPRDVTAIADGQVAVLYHERQLLAFLSTQTKLCLETTVTTTKGYVAIAGYDQTHLAATCVFPSTIDIIQTDGKIVRSVDMFKIVPIVESTLFFNPWYISCSQKGEIIVSEYSKKFVLVLTKNFSSKFIYKSDDDSLKSARGVCSDRHGNVLLVDEVSCNIRVISPAGRFLGYALSKENGVENPLNVAHGNNGEIVVLQKNGHVKVFLVDDNVKSDQGCWELQI